jgi:hypothetical protein
VVAPEIFVNGVPLENSAQLEPLLEPPSQKMTWRLEYAEEAGVKTVWLSCFKPGTLLLIR